MSVTLFQARFEIDEVIETDPGVEWQLNGQVFDSSNMGFSADNAEVGDLIFCSNYYGDVDRFRITSVGAKSWEGLACLVVYDEPGTPRIGQPVVGSAVICASTLLNKLGFAPAGDLTQLPDSLTGGVIGNNNKKIDDPIAHAANVVYVNTTSGLNAVNTQAAIDELKSIVAGAGANHANHATEVIPVTVPTQYVYTLAHSPIANSEIVALNGMTLANGADCDYTISGPTVTFDAGVVFKLGNRLLFKYLY